MSDLELHDRHHTDAPFEGGITAQEFSRVQPPTEVVGSHGYDSKWRASIDGQDRRSEIDSRARGRS